MISADTVSTDNSFVVVVVAVGRAISAAVAIAASGLCVAAAVTLTLLVLTRSDHVDVGGFVLEGACKAV